MATSQKAVPGESANYLTPTPMAGSPPVTVTLNPAFPASPYH